MATKFVPNLWALMILLTGAKELQGSLDRCLSQARLLRRNTIFTQKLMQSLLNGVTDEVRITV